MHRREDNIEKDLKETGFEGGDWLQVADSCEQDNEPSVSIQGREFTEVGVS